MDIFEEPENHRVFLDHKVPKKMIFSQSRVSMAMQGCILVLRVGAQKSIWTISEKPKNQRVFQDHKVPKNTIFSQSRVSMAMQGCILMLRIGPQ